MSSLTQRGNLGVYFVEDLKQPLADTPNAAVTTAVETSGPASGTIKEPAPVNSTRDYSGMLWGVAAVASIYWLLRH